ncbi:MAG: hypothetical protein Q9170_004975 [Blastenia crenularia]
MSAPSHAEYIQAFDDYLKMDRSEFVARFIGTNCRPIIDLSGLDMCQADSAGYKETLANFLGLLQERNAFFDRQRRIDDPATGIFYEHLYRENEILVPKAAAWYEEVKKWDVKAKAVSIMRAYSERGTR